MKTYRVPHVIVFACGLLAAAASAAQPEVKTLSNAEAAAPATLTDFKGLVGDWVGPQGAASFSAVLSGQMVGHLVLLNDDKSPRVEELWIIRQEGTHVIVRQKHYASDLKAREDKDQWAERAVVALDSNDIYLNNLTWVTRGHALQLLVKIPSANGGPPQQLVFAFTRAK